jgi:hypothetical protein
MRLVVDTNVFVSAALKEIRCPLKTNDMPRLR